MLGTACMCVPCLCAPCMCAPCLCAPCMCAPCMCAPCLCVHAPCDAGALLDAGADTRFTHKSQCAARDVEPLLGAGAATHMYTHTHAHNRAHALLVMQSPCWARVRPRTCTHTHACTQQSSCAPCDAEPLLDAAAEAQAIGRVHRIGQTRETHIHRCCIRARGGGGAGTCASWRATLCSLLCSPSSCDSNAGSHPLRACCRTNP